MRVLKIKYQRWLPQVEEILCPWLMTFSMYYITPSNTYLQYVVYKMKLLTNCLVSSVHGKYFIITVVFCSSNCVGSQSTYVFYLPKYPNLIHLKFSLKLFWWFFVTYLLIVFVDCFSIYIFLFFYELFPFTSNLL